MKKGENSQREQAGRFDPYKVLKVSKGASFEEIKRAYNALAQKFYPGNNDNLSDAERKRLQLLYDEAGRAYDALTRDMQDAPLSPKLPDLDGWRDSYMQ